MGNRGMDDLIPVVNKLQDAFSRLGKECPLDLPQIAVVGGQSAGKSSVLENFVGKDFLPRGSGIVTRRPLVLQLYYHKGREYGEFLHTGSKKFTDFNAIRKEIEDETDRETGSNKGISSIPINLRVYSPNVLNLTLIDLPGMTKIAVGDQPADIEIQIRSMLMEFITKENCLILAVSPANSDLANSDALKLAKEVDPQGLRTIGVLTKLDLMDEGTDAKEILENKLLPLRRGYVGVVNRSQKDIDGNKDIKAALAAENRFFSTHQSYKHIADKMGTKKLQEVLNQQLTNHIRDTLPELKKSLEEQINMLEEECKDWQGINSARGKPAALMMQLIQKYSQEFWALVNGGSDTVIFDELSGGAKINRIFHERFPYDLSKHEYDERQLRKEIATIILNVKGVHSGLFTPDQAFNSVCQRQIGRFTTPSTECADNTMSELLDLANQCSERMAAYPRLRDAVDNMVSRFIRDNHAKCIDQINNLIKIELSYMNTNHPDFIGFQNATNAAEKGQKITKGRRGVAPNQIIRKGYLHSPGTIGNKEVWFILSADSLAWYKDDKEEEQKYLLKLDGLRLRDADKGFMSRNKFTIELYNPNAKYLYKEKPSLVLSASNEGELDGWKASFLRAGIFPDKEDDNDDGDDYGSLDPTMERRVETIRNLVDSYISIVGTTVRDYIPKLITYQMIDKVRADLELLFAEIVFEESVESLMEESAEEKDRRENTMAMLKMAKEAMAIISDVKTGTKYEAAPPPIAEDKDILARAMSNSRAPGGSRPPPAGGRPQVNSRGTPASPKGGVPQRPGAPGRPQRPGSGSGPSSGASVPPRPRGATTTGSTGGNANLPKRPTIPRR